MPSEDTHSIPSNIALAIWSLMVIIIIIITTTTTTTAAAAATTTTTIMLCIVSGLTHAH